MERQAPPPSSKPLLRFWARRAEGPLRALLRRYSWTLPVIAALGLLASVLESVGIGLIIPLAAILLDDAAGDLPRPIMALLAATAGFDTQSRILILCGLLVGFILFKALVQSGNNVLIENVYGRIARDIQNALCRRVLALDYPFFLRTPNSRLVHIISTDSWQTAEALRYATQIMTAAIALAVFGALLLWINWPLALIIAVGGIAIQSLLLLIERRQRTFSALVVANNHVLAERMLAVVSAMRAIRIFGQQERELDKFADAAEQTRRSAVAIRRISASVVQLVEALVAVLFVVVLIVGYRLGGVSVPELIAFLVLLARAQPHAKAISRARIEIAAVSGAVREVEWLLLQEPAPISLAGSRPVPAIDRPIRFADVTYRYRKNVPAVHRVNATIRPGTVTALIGKSGSGKTTLVNLLCRLVEPTTGALLHGDDVLGELDPRQWRSHIAIAGQDVDLLDGTIADNIAYGKPDAGREDIELAARTAGASGFIEALERGYDTHLGLETLELSGGERQRIGLARALLKRPDLLILDEATNAVDSISEGEIVKLLVEHRHFRTALVISHRKSTLAVCQDCIVLDNGRVVEAGPLEGSSYYREMA